jgi:hypothetical protein
MTERRQKMTTRTNAAKRRYRSLRKEGYGASLAMDTIAKEFPEIPWSFVRG